ncbi:hypothetical protein HNR00_003408 [Methylorubrum rhodinum]|uniref:Uncharacterized protein n=1 Tax=Methylorubrum rhodinum TaxID=29428 RepID=A0A840ZNQ7_9HYPH|nr:hypothetical protein [Methylorubrum rhodinum]MBB5758685.1 hypothetical protein [Methylorubrum rhodinum]
MSPDPDHPTKPLRREPGPRGSMQQNLLLVCMIASGGMLTGSLFALLSDGSLLGTVKVFFCVLGGMAVSYGVNRCAIDRGAPLAVVGYRSAAVASVLSILIVGAGLFGATYAGLVLKDVDRLRLEAHGTALGEYVGARAGDTAMGAAVAPVLASIADDLERKALCERAGSCVSGRPAGGRGLVARTLEAMAERAKGVAAQFETGVGTGAAKGTEIGDLLARFGAIAGGSDPAAEKRVRLQDIDARIRQALAARKEAAPLGLALGYAAELQAAGTIAGQPEASRALSTILQAHARSLRGVGTASAVTAAAPAFPKAAGVADTFAHLGHFLPVAAITAVVELVFPLVLWVYVALTLAWEIEQKAPRPLRPPHDDDDATRLILGRPGRLNGRDVADPNAYFRGLSARRPTDDERYGSH